MKFAQEGFLFMLIAALLPAGEYAAGAGGESWPLWLLAGFLTVIALWVACFFRDPGRVGERGERTVRQIAGTIARRIVTDSKVGEQVDQAARMEMPA